MTTPPHPDPGAAPARDKAKLALILAAISPVLSAFLLLSLVLLRLALGPLPRPAAWLVLLPQLAAALLAAHAAAILRRRQPLHAALLAAVMAATFGLHIARQATAWACIDVPLFTVWQSRIERRAHLLVGWRFQRSRPASERRSARLGPPRPSRFHRRFNVFEGIQLATPEASEVSRYTKP